MIPLEITADVTWTRTLQVCRLLHSLVLSALINDTYSARDAAELSGRRNDQLLHVVPVRILVSMLCRSDSGAHVVLNYRL